MGERKDNCLPFRDVKMFPELLNVSYQVPSSVLLQASMGSTSACAPLKPQKTHIKQLNGIL